MSKPEYILTLEITETEISGICYLCQIDVSKGIEIMVVSPVINRIVMHVGCFQQFCLISYKFATLMANPVNNNIQEN